LDITGIVHASLTLRFRRFKPAKGSEADLCVYPNLYRNNIPAYIRVAAGFVYLAVILDACSRKVIGYALSQQIDTPLALAALDAAYAARQPCSGCGGHLSSNDR
jgi:putative transposase